MDDLVERFRAEAVERFERIRELSVDDTLGDDRYEAIREEAHKLKGAAGMLGFSELKERAAELEDLVRLGPDSASALGVAVARMHDALPA